jgi:hypothetical protein
MDLATLDGADIAGRVAHRTSLAAGVAAVAAPGRIS